MADETFLDLGVQADSKEVQAFSNDLEKVIKSLDTLSKKLDKAVSTINKYTSALSEQVKAQAKALGIEEEHTDTTQENTDATEENTDAVDDNNTATDDNTTKVDENTDATEKNTEEKKKQNNEIKKLIRGYLAFVGAITGAFYALNRLTADLAKSNQAMLNLTRNTDIALATFQKWDGLGKLFGIENAEQQLSSLNEKIFNLKLTGEGARGFQLAGIMPTNAEDVLEQLRNRVKGMSDTSATYLLQQMGIDPQMLTLLRMSREEFTALGEEIKKYQLTPEQRVQIQQMNAQIQLAGQKLEYFKNILVIELMPHFVKLMQAIATVTERLASFVTWLTKSDSTGARITRTILKITAVFALWLASIKGVVLLLTKLPLMIGAITKAVTVLRGALTLLSAHPIVAAITAIIGALMLLADDISHYYNGGGSVLGVIMKGLQDLDIKGFLDFPVPKWLEMLIEAIDFFKNPQHAAKNGLEIQAKKSGLKDAKVIKQSDGSFGMVELAPGYATDPNGNLKKSSGADRLSYLRNASATNQMINNYNSNAINNTNNSPSITQNIEIATNQPANDIQQSLKYANALVTA